MTTELIDAGIECEMRPGFQFPPEFATDASSSVRLMRRYAELTGRPFMCVDASSGEVLAESDADDLELLPAELRRQLPGVAAVCPLAQTAGLLFYALPLPDIGGRKAVAVTYVFAHPNAHPHDVVLAAAEQNWSQERLERWMSRQTHCHPAMFQSMLEMAVNQARQECRDDSIQLELDQLGQQIEQTYEEISLLHSLTQNLQISRSPVELAELCLSRLPGLIRSASNVIWLDEKNGQPRLLIDGEVLFDELGLAQLLARFEDHNWSRPLVKNHIEGTLLGADFPALQNLVVVSIAEGTHRSGWILSCNLSAGREFGTVEASLLNSIATILGTHVRNIDLYRQHDELLLSFVRSLVSTLDARDRYTRGHSQRVALIGRRLGEELNLPDDDLRDIYLSGLLHDIGKIGISDTILQKTGKLTKAEYEIIQEHPMIGYHILSGVKNLNRVLPGVRNHHEQYNGRGYPDRLTGEDIPLLARILAVADGYDAMGSDRPYRKGMPLEKIETIFRDGAGSQWDARVIEAYFSARDDIARICRSYSLENAEMVVSHREGEPALLSN